jgi:hypothetical protein
MTSLHLLDASLVLHICGLAVWTGSTVAEYILFKQFWKIHDEDKEKADAAYLLLLRLGPLAGAGAALVVLSGITMFSVTGGVFGSHTWFQVKMMLLLIAITNGLVVGRPLKATLRRLLKNETAGKNNMTEFAMIKRRMKVFHIVQMSIFLLIFVCSTFKFN